MAPPIYFEAKANREMKQRRREKAKRWEAYSITEMGKGKTETRKRNRVKDGRKNKDNREEETRKGGRLE